MLSKEQLYYITQIYPEKVSKEEAEEDFLRAIGNTTEDGNTAEDAEAFITYWEAVEQVINKLIEE